MDDLFQVEFEAVVVYADRKIAKIRKIFEGISRTAGAIGLRQTGFDMLTCHDMTTCHDMMTCHEMMTCQDMMTCHAMMTCHGMMTCHEMIDDDVS